VKLSVERQTAEKSKKNRYPEKIFQNNGWLRDKMVEAAGIEPASENGPPAASTGLGQV